MSADPHWDYAQARLQARHGDRVPEADWRALDAVQTADAFIERCRGTALRRFTEQLNAGMSSHTIERVLRAAWRVYVGDVASWLPEAWRPAVAWTAVLPDLPVVDAILKGEMPAWARHDPQLTPFMDVDAAQRRVALQKSPFAPLLPDEGAAPATALRWAQHWRALRPPQGATDQRALAALAQAMQSYIEHLALAGARETSATYRRELEQTATRLFRRHPASPTAVFSHLVLTALDLERLRGGIVRRRLFQSAQPRSAA